MASAALQAWRTIASARLDELEQVHVQATGAARGRRWHTAQLNRSLFVMLVAQFQSYCRDLHDAAVEVHVAKAAHGQGPVLRNLLTQGRKLDVQNPRPSALGSNFGRLGFSLIADMNAARSTAGVDLEHLDDLIDFRNAIGHGNEAVIASIEAAGSVRSTKTAYLKSRRTINRLAGTIDDVVAAKLAALLGVTRPW
jgi:hypothetical protein